MPSSTLLILWKKPATAPSLIPLRVEAAPAVVAMIADGRARPARPHPSRVRMPLRRKPPARLPRCRTPDPSRPLRLAPLNAATGAPIETMTGAAAVDAAAIATPVLVRKLYPLTIDRPCWQPLSKVTLRSPVTKLTWARALLEPMEVDAGAVVVVAVVVAEAIAKACRWVRPHQLQPIPRCQLLVLIPLRATILPSPLTRLILTPR